MLLWSSSIEMLYYAMYLRSFEVSWFSVHWHAPFGWRSSQQSIDRWLSSNHDPNRRRFSSFSLPADAIPDQRFPVHGIQVSATLGDPNFLPRLQNRRTINKVARRESIVNCWKCSLYKCGSDGSLHNCIICWSHLWNQYRWCTEVVITKYNRRPCLKYHAEHSSTSVCQWADSNFRLKN